MPTRQDTMMSPPIEDLLERGRSKFALVTLSSKRAREINSYFNQLGEGLGAIVPPQVTSVARKPLSIAFEEIGGGKIVPVDISELAESDAAGDDADDAAEPALTPVDGKGGKGGKDKE